MRAKVMAVQWGGGHHGFTLVEILIVVAIIGVLAGLAVPNYLKARANAQRTACINNLRVLEAAKQNWALENKKPDGARPKQADLLPYLKGQKLPVCPAGGAYKIQRLGRDPYCSRQAEGHNLNILYSDPDSD